LNPQFGLTRRFVVQISAITINVDKLENNSLAMGLLNFRADFEEKCKKVG